ncbi:EAL domain-containing protein (putative c-di-GMP-specific phosphodiesterase class I) [Actinoplanes octamycinicus]|uniref:EAL domain-containing protein (Putative c-di-GMP-specific phosphodiesterase class I) n=1 Tax=Actinoplanes octamycinicus TaxID=135948 RepID=A0A7W7H1U8_9ACTN|nr:EAL domain-containing protein [Actinoplanes octamycinicus]MBB4742358.1 EAL domain-containing protein (putative c-di-GMP-specific phosphodiesterase class I) [Actinoplanes octamycinicus]GIE62393.1 hypothetical protein Aoc01nite_77950 [Actinoplanes octamycinicus]
MVRTADRSISEVLRDRLVFPVFQPIVDLATGGVVGLEALARGPAGTALEFPDRLFAAAHQAARLGALDMLCCERALESAVTAAVPPPLLFVNAEPSVLDQPLSARLLEILDGGLPFRMVLEFTERALPAVPGSLLRLAGMVHGWGNGLALDDVGVDPMSLAFLPLVEPEVIKLDMSVVRDPDSAHARQVAAVVRAEALRTGARVIAEGIETEQHLRAALDLGAHWGQGWLFGRPGPIEQADHRYQPAELRAPRPGFHQPPGTPFATAAGHGPVVPADDATVTAFLDGLTDTALIIVAGDPGRPLPELAARARSLISVDEPVPGELTVVALGAGHGRALAVRPGTGLITCDDVPTVAAVARALLTRYK